MAGLNVPIVLIPRFTSYVGGGIYDTLPIPISAYESLVLSFWMNTGVGTAPTLSVSLLESNDLDRWEPCVGTPVTPVPGSEVQMTVTLSKAWFRFLVSLSPADAGFTVWAQGFLQLREK